MHTIETVFTKDAPPAIGPYSQAKAVGSMLFTSGQIPINPKSGEVDQNDITWQATQALENLMAVLKAGNSCAENVIKTTCFLADMGDFLAFNKVYEGYFPGNPARSCVAVKTLPKNVLCEVEAIALRNE